MRERIFGHADTRLGLILLIVIIFYIEDQCFAEMSNEKYLELLKKAVDESCGFVSGCVLGHPTNCGGTDWDSGHCPPDLNLLKDWALKRQFPSY